MNNENKSIYADWNPWHGCTKISAGCKYCYVKASSVCKKNLKFEKPMKRNSGIRLFVNPVIFD